MFLNFWRTWDLESQTSTAGEGVSRHERHDNDAALAVDNVSMTSAPTAFVKNDMSSDSARRRSRCATSSSWAKRGLQFEDLDGFRPRLGRQPVDGVSHVQSGVARLLDADSFHFTGCVSRLAVNLPE